MSGGRLLALYINNKSGGLIYQRNFAASAAKLRDNDQLTVASMLSSIALILQVTSDLFYEHPPPHTHIQPHPTPHPSVSNKKTKTKTKN
ncbi:hypothetical protein T492DRAFT_372268 [Pavlovales sp. CCMP2436]|nr:hypothetical protein T492DRAFT_372268 [Pavlovales sp. CCMP2436]